MTFLTLTHSPHSHMLMTFLTLTHSPSLSITKYLITSPSINEYLITSPSLTLPHPQKKGSIDPYITTYICHHLDIPKNSSKGRNFSSPMLKMGEQISYVQLKYDFIKHEHAVLKQKLTSYQPSANSMNRTCHSKCNAKFKISYIV